MAYEKLGRFFDAFQDLRTLMVVEPQNKTAKASLDRLLPLATKEQQRSSAKHSLVGILDVLRDQSSSADQKKEALQSLAVFTNSKAEDTGKNPADVMSTLIQEDGFILLQNYINDDQLKIWVFRILVNMAESSKEYSLKIFSTFNLKTFLNILMTSTNADEVGYCASILSHISAALEDERTRKRENPEKEKAEEISRKTWDEIVAALVHVLTTSNKSIAFKALLKIPWRRKDVMGFMKHVPTVMTAASTLKLKDSTSNPKDYIPLFVSKILTAAEENAKDPKSTEEYISVKKCFQETISSWLQERQVETSLNALRCLCGFMLGDNQLGTEILLKEVSNIVGVLDLTQGKANSEEISDEITLLTAEIFALAAGNKQFRAACDAEALDELFSLLKSEKPEVQARVAAAAAKFASTNAKLREDLLKNKGKDTIQNIIQLLDSGLKENNSGKSDSGSVEQWAVESLSFVSLYPEIKEQITNQDISSRLVKISRTHPSLRYGIASIWMNVSAFRPRRDEVQELQQKIQQMANKEEQKEKNPLDDDDKVMVRCAKLVDSGVVSSIYDMIRDEKHRSQGLFMLAAQILASLANNQKIRGKMVQEGAMKTLIILYHGSPSGSEAPKEEQPSMLSRWNSPLNSRTSKITTLLP
eukprot:TRINITY_DN2109_c0_g3_i1.p1 TRINITY_DN2109_c0_g3~~TRINITY_DN2109_c0_g3_i1.p1  ORF type:complete len:730 (-),score=253.34 TRINITY_DN2109_c0_g3_i1:68-1999(-)